MVIPYETMSHGINDDRDPDDTFFKISVSQAARLHDGKVQVEGIISGISKLKKIIKSQEYECALCGNVMKVTPNITFQQEQKSNIPVERPDVHTHLGEKVTINGNIRVITFPRRDTVSYLYAEKIAYESSQEIVITNLDKSAIEKLVRVAKSRKKNVLDILGSMFAPEIIGNNIIKQGMLLCAASTNTDEN
jgi:DNA replicative helicase MCM subunit Mcm2 (Cdc46/Mcm family)